jgi:hypothetical protein
MGTRYPTDPEVKLASITCEIAMLAAEHFHGKPHDELAAWVGRQLAGCGFENQPIGAMWTCLTRVHDSKIDTEVPSMDERLGSFKAAGIALLEANRPD